MNYMEDNFYVKMRELNKYYNKIKNNKSINPEDELMFLKIVISVYSGYTKKMDFNKIIEQYKIKYIYNESKVEENISPEEQLGIGIVYDYIRDFDFEKDKFNIFTNSLLIHQKLYSKCPGEGFGGSLRNETVYLLDTNIEVEDPIIAKRKFNEYILKSNDLFKPLEHGDLLRYIENSIVTITDLIKLQPFADGNKRTFRSILNLLLKKVSLPPVFIDNSYKLEYKEALLKAMQEDNYDDIVLFYYQRMYDAIMQLDINNRQMEKITNKKR